MAHHQAWHARGGWHFPPDTYDEDEDGRGAVAGGASPPSSSPGTGRSAADPAAEAGRCVTGMDGAGEGHVRSRSFQEAGWADWATTTCLLAFFVRVRLLVS